MQRVDIPAHALPELLRETRAAAVADAEAGARGGIEEAGGWGETRRRRHGGDEEERRRESPRAGDAAVQEMVRIIHLRRFSPAMLKVQSPKKDDAE